MIMAEEVILVDRNDQQIGLMEKIKAHEEGLLHRAFSVVVFNDKQEMLIHQRAKSKYHCGGLWTNACCSHPRENESTIDAANRRLVEEMGFSAPLNYVEAFIYKVSFENGLTEHEYDHVFVARYNNKPNPNPDEVENYKYIAIDELKKDVAENPEKYTFWFKEIINSRLTKILNKLTYDESLQKNDI